MAKPKYRVRKQFSKVLKIVSYQGRGVRITPNFYGEQKSHESATSMIENSEAIAACFEQNVIQEGMPVVLQKDAEKEAVRKPKAEAKPKQKAEVLKEAGATSAPTPTSKKKAEAASGK